VIVAPEKVFSVPSAAESTLVGSMRALARSSGVELVIGFVLDDSASGGSLSNVAMAFPASGGQPAAYRKQHLVPSYESAFVPGHSPVEVVDGSARIGLAICKDMDFPAVSRSYAQSGTGLLAVPARDFTTDAWLHSRIALTAGVATGQPVARAARDGALTVSDAAGRVGGRGPERERPGGECPGHGCPRLS
jgi:apolipoprotein N-acyltransferase